MPLAALIVFEAVIVVMFRALLAMHRPNIPVIAAILAMASPIEILLTIGRTSVLAIGLSLSGAFAVAPLTLVAALAYTVGRKALPDAGIMARWANGALAALAAWRLAGSYGIEKPLTQIAAAAILAATYNALLAVLLPGHCVQAADAIKQTLDLGLRRTKSR